MNVQGKIKYETISFLFNTYVPHPKKCKEMLDDVVYQLYQKYYQNDMIEKVVTVEEKGFLGIPKKVEKITWEESKPLHCVEDIIYKEYDFPHYDEIYDLNRAISDLEYVMQTKCVAKRSQNNCVLGDMNTLLALERVEEKPYYYETLEKSIDEILKFD